VHRVEKLNERYRKPGNEVCARADDFRIGTFAEYIAVKEESVAMKPKALSMGEAASIPLVGLTAWQALIETANLRRGLRISRQPSVSASGHALALGRPTPYAPAGQCWRPRRRGPRLCAV
jgi:NADPH:quinone reductase-like Zn-dependent oxidoreductase